MFPFIFEWVWDIAHMVFMGGLWYALGIMGLGMTYCVMMALKDTLQPSNHIDHYHDNNHH